MPSAGPSCEPVPLMDNQSASLVDDLDNSIIYNLFDNDEDDNQHVGSFNNPEVIVTPAPCPPRIITPRPSRKKTTSTIDELKLKLEAKIMSSAIEKNHMADAINSTVLNAFKYLSEDKQLELMMATTNFVNDFLKTNK